MKQIAISEELYEHLKLVKEDRSFSSYIAKVSNAYEGTPPKQKLAIDLNKLFSENRWVLSQAGITSGGDLFIKIFPE